MRFSVTASQDLVGGLDEVGRGPLAGPVVAAVALLPRADQARWRDQGVTDSKALSAPRREALARALLADAAVILRLGAASSREIDQINILQATFLAMRRAVGRLPEPPAHLLVDGNRIPPGLPCPATAVIGGDASEVAIGAASIVAKVVRDRVMAALDRRYPGYGWGGNAGYPTAAHRAALIQLGATAHHRFSFAPLRTLESSR